MQKFNETDLKTRVGKLIASKKKIFKSIPRGISRKIDVHVRTIGKIEHGRSFVTADALCKLSQVLICL